MLWPLKKRAGQNSQLGIVLDAGHGGAAVAVARSGDGCRLLYRRICTPPGAQPWPLTELLGGRREAAVGVLDPAAYQLLLVERPDVPDAEVAQAVRWRLRELLSFPVEEAIVDIFDVPRQARGGRNMVYAVAAQSGAVDALVAQLGEASVALHAIDVPELCLRNIATSLEQDRFGVACLLVQGTRGLLTLTREQQLYLVRQMEVPENAAVDDNAIAQVALEVQRSLDYFESHYDQRPIRDVLLAPSLSAPALSEALAREMTVNVAALDLNEIVEVAEPLSAEEQAGCLLALGAALRGPDVMERAA